MRKVIEDAEFWRELANFKQSAWRFEQQPAYAVGYERGQFDAFLAGRPQPPTDNPELRDWMESMARHTREGRTIGRVRIVDEPMTDYQRWLRWVDRWNLEAGETIDYLSRRRALEVGLLPHVGPEDWWFLDDTRLMLMHFNAEGAREKVELIVGEPQVARALEWREFAIRAAREESATDRLREIV